MAVRALETPEHNESKIEAGDKSDDADGSTDATTEAPEKKLSALEPYPDKNDISVLRIRKEIEASESDFEAQFLASLVHYGYIAMFTTIFPLAPLLELLYVMLDSHLDFLGMLESRRTSFIRREMLLAPPALTTISVVACFCTIGLLWVSLEEEKRHRDQLANSWEATGAQFLFGEADFENASTRLLFVFAVEHVLLLTNFIVSYVVNDEAEHVTDMRAKKFFQLRTDSWHMRRQLAGERDFDELPIDIHSSTANKRREMAKLLAKKVAPTFGIPANAMFVATAICILICYLRIMPFGLSELWLIVALFVILGYFSEKKTRIDRQAAIGIVSDPHLVEMVAKEMPSWHKFQDTERAEWLNVVLTAAWPHVNNAVSRLVKGDIVEPLLDSIPGVRMTDFTLGTNPLKCVGLRAAQTSFDAVHLDLDIKWASELYARLEIGIKGVPLPIELEDLQFSATLRVTAKPLFPELNPLGGLELTFLQKPHVHFGFNVGGIDAMSVNLPQVRIAQQVKDLISGILENLMVYPTQLLVYDNKAGTGEYIGALLKPTPKGILQFTIVEAHNLPRMDHSVLLHKKTSSDPYVEWTSSENQTAQHDKHRRTHVVKKTHMNPKWAREDGPFRFEVLIHDPNIAVMSFSIYDEDLKIGPFLGQDDLIGKCEIKLKNLRRNSSEKHTLGVELAEGVEDAKVREKGLPLLIVKTNYITLNPIKTSDDDHELLYDGEVDDSVIISDKISSPNKRMRTEEVLQGSDGTLGVLAVRGISIEDVKRESDHRSDRIYVKVDCGNVSQKTSKKKSSGKQNFLEAFYFIVRHPMTATVHLTVMLRQGKLRQAAAMMSNAATITGVHAPDRTLGTVTVSVRELIESGGQMQIMGGQQNGTFTDKKSSSGNIAYNLEYVHNRTTR